MRPKLLPRLSRNFGKWRYAKIILRRRYGVKPCPHFNEIKLLEVEAEMTSGSKSVVSEWATWCQESSEVHEDWKKKIDEMNRLLDEISEELSRHIERCQMLKVDLITDTTNPDVCNAVNEGVEARMRCDEQISKICTEANSFGNA